MEVLCTKHLDTCPPSASSLETYLDRPPELVPVDITDDTVTEVAGRLSGEAGPGGTDSVILQHWLLHFGAAIEELRLEVADFTEWLGNRRPQWAAYQVMMSGRLVAPDKKPGVRPVGVGETWRHLMEKCVLRVTGQEAKDVCGTEHPAGGVEEGIEGEIHSMVLIWAHNSK